MLRWYRRRKARKIAAEIASLQTIYHRAVKSHGPRKHIHKLMVELRARQLRLEVQ